MKELKKLIDLKSIVTLIFCATFSILVCKEIITAEQFMIAFTMILTFYFAKADKKQIDNTEEI